MSRTDLWTRAALAMREDPDPRWHAVADWLRSEAACQDEMEPFAELLNATIEQASGVKGYIRFARTADGDPMLSIDTNEGATAVASAYLDGTIDPDVDPDDPDDEVFCPRCVAGAASDEHHEKCVLTGHAEDGEPAPAPGLHDRCHEHADVIASQRNSAIRHRGPVPADEHHTDDGRCLDPAECADQADAAAVASTGDVDTLRRERDEALLDRADLLDDRALLRQACIEIAGAAAALADNSVEGHAKAATRAMDKARATIADLEALAERLRTYRADEHPTPSGIHDPDDYGRGINVSGLEIRVALTRHR